MRAIGCLLLLAVLAAFVLEGWVVDLVARRIGEASELGHPEYLGAMVMVAVLSFVGWRLMRWRMARLPVVVMGGGDFGREAVAIAGAAMITFPGFISGAIGILLQLPPVQRLFGRAAGTVMAAIIRQAAGRMGAGQMPGGMPGAGMPGGFPGGGMPGGFPGMPGGPASGGPGQGGPLRPDQQQKGKRIIDVEKES